MRVIDENFQTDFNAIGLLYLTVQFLNFGQLQIEKNVSAVMYT